MGEKATTEDGELISQLFGAIGKVWRADEKLFDAVTGLRHVLSLMFLKPDLLSLNLMPMSALVTSCLLSPLGDLSSSELLLPIQAEFMQSWESSTIVNRVYSFSLKCQW